GRARLLAWQAEVAEFHRLGGITEIEHLEHAGGAPAGHARDEKADAGVAFPPALVGVAIIAADSGHEPGVCGVGDVPDFMRDAPERAQQIDRVRIALRQALAVADPRHLRAALLLPRRRECARDISAAPDHR